MADEYEYECGYNGCKKRYGSEVMLGLHLKQAHGVFDFKVEDSDELKREKLAERLMKEQVRYLSRHNAIERVTMASKMKCGSCGAPLQKGQKRCEYCRTGLF